MIGTGAPIARPVVRRPGSFQAHYSVAPVRFGDTGPRIGPWQGLLTRSSSKQASSGSEGAARRVEYSVRTARITDIERLVALSGDQLAAGGSSPLDAADLLRQLVFLPHATVLVAERRRDIVGGAVLAIRPSVRAGGYVGTIDLLVVDPAGEPEAVAASLIEECVRSAANKGCAAVEAPQPDDPAERARWERREFNDTGSYLRRPVAPAGRRR
jgi:hypothetical protein